MTVYHRRLEAGRLQFISDSTCRRVPVFLNRAYCWLFVDAVQAVRAMFGFLRNGWVLKPGISHSNHLARRLVESRDRWSWSSWRFYNLGDRSLLGMDPVG
jgi:hypothetical protein